MKIKQSDSERLVIIDGFPWSGSFVCLCLSIFMFCKSVEWFENGFDYWNKVFRLAFGLLPSVLLLFTACVQSAKSFEFDLLRRQFIWKRRGLFINKSGFIPFNRIKCAAVDCLSPIGTFLEYRVVLSTTEGIFPLGEIYEARKNEECDRLRNAINQALRVNDLKEEDRWLLKMSAAEQRQKAIQEAAAKFKINLARAEKMVDKR